MAVNYLVHYAADENGQMVQDLTLDLPILILKIVQLANLDSPMLTFISVDDLFFSCF